MAVKVYFDREKNKWGVKDTARAKRTGKQQLFTLKSRAQEYARYYKAIQSLRGVRVYFDHLREKWSVDYRQQSQGRTLERTRERISSDLRETGQYARKISAQRKSGVDHLTPNEVKDAIAAMEILRNPENADLKGKSLVDAALKEKSYADLAQRLNHFKRHFEHLRVGDLTDSSLLPYFEDIEHASSESTRNAYLRDIGNFFNHISSENIKITAVKMTILSHEFEEKHQGYTAGRLAWKSDTVILQIFTDQGIIGIGEGSPYGGLERMKEYMEK